MPHVPSHSRNPRIEALRLVAIAGIALFHTFQPWFSAATDGSWAAGPLITWALGCVSLLGAYGNHVFFLISGLFLVPRAAQASTTAGYWPDQVRKTGRRALTILASVALYALVALAVSTGVVPVEGVSLHEAGWLVGGLEFVWLYLVFVALVPLVGWTWRRMRRPHAAVFVLVSMAFALNAYIAFLSPGEVDRGLLEWRKLMSAASYLVAFLVGGVLGETQSRRPARALAACAAVAVVVEGAAAFMGSSDVLVALSFKSTSALSFALAVLSVAYAARSADAATAPASTPTNHAAALTCRAAPCVLGFYLAQSVFSPLWRPLADALTQAAAAGGDVALLVAGTAFSLALLAVMLLTDALVRLPLLRWLGLA